MKVLIMSTGDEVFLGEVDEKNGGFIARELVASGFDVLARMIVEDDMDKILKALDFGFNNVDLIIMTGGLGPTHDDLTREAVASYFGVDLEEREEAREWLHKFFEKLGRKPPLLSDKQTLFPKGAEIIPNELGTACGFIFKSGEKMVVALSGVPWEAERMFSKYLLPKLPRLGGITLRRIHTTGLRETELYLKVKDLDLQGTKLGICASPPGVTLYLRGSEDSVSYSIDLLKRSLGAYVYGEEGKTLEEVVAELLWEKGFTLSVAESCTGGFLAHRLTNIPGSSKYFSCGIVSYSNKAKEDILGVPLSLIEDVGAVSAEVAEKMAKEVRRLGKSDLGIGITGIAGPTGGRPEKPVGTVYIGLSWGGGSFVEKNLFSGPRDVVKYRATQRALDLLRRFLLGVSPFESKGNN
ncbi:MAG: CinA family nicotinamide mononucleotide deamidase-related protein [Synergistetes bacterium]|nr:CinA family nicotinamide mononucleotide deamidase-related protein [Synergistota bacterium]MCX8127862.1 CinA family nicotinamide mononucleotide deamidase-related protein [Synergistota bacterium]MDW8192124.1 CinA family nicotinamide mononucleotide deamidase-related protein [Synergistota bacterium]